ncbi:tyrosine-type recombinase/integrase [Enterococcus faecalis]|nr:tyrosine-type recombinase/integrase [Enterococcus faecalis]NSV46487.1 tyrosine-type recombinase/integrase [Enterococcus faecalis]TQA42743.1 tyrosine-type recombinase/integrase [Enterococcus faecalis]HDT8171231.1 tyrosine-type recombinase/integrase [Enterococcus faecalis]
MSYLLKYSFPPHFTLDGLFRKALQQNRFRHTHASLLFESGTNFKEVQERLAHTNISMTMNIYTHVTKKGQEETAQKFANYVNF